VLITIRGGRFAFASAACSAVTVFALRALAQDQVLPILVAGGSEQESHQSAVVLSNPASLPVRCTFDLFGPDGSRWAVLANDRPAVGPLTLDIAPGATSTMWITSASPSQTGWARVRCPQRWPIASHAVVRRVRERQTLGEATIVLPPNIFAANLIHDPTSDAHTSIAIVNPNQVSNRIGISVADSGGRERDRIQITLRPNESLVTSAADLSRSSGGDRETRSFRLTSQLPVVAGGLARYPATTTDLEVHSTVLERYGFEDGTMQGWLPDRTPGNDAIRRCFVSATSPLAGTASLVCEIDLECAVPAKRNGEVSIFLAGNPPDPSFTAPINFETAIVRALLGISQSMPGDLGFQLFVKDPAFRSLYSDFRRAGELGGAPLEVSPGQPVRPGGFVAPGFDATNIVTIGIKVGCSDGSTSRFSGQIRIDSISW
jgi:hypothetical protein